MTFRPNHRFRRIALLPAVAAWLVLAGPAAAGWQAERIPTPGKVTAIETSGVDALVAVGSNWYQLVPDAKRLAPASAPKRPAAPTGAMPDSRVAVGKEGVVRAWLAEPTRRYGHGVLGDAVEAGSLVIERTDGRRVVVRLGPDSVFEDLEPRIAKLDGADRIIVVRSYLDRGSALAVVDPMSASIIAETPPIGRPNAWLNPAGIADFDGDGAIDIAFVRQPHVAGRLELWTWRNGTLAKSAEIADASNHVIGSRVLGMSAIADFDGDGVVDLALPSLDRRTLRVIAFSPRPRDIAAVRLQSRIVTNIATVVLGGRSALVAGLEDGALLLVYD